MKLKRVDLFRRLDQVCYQALESATVLCKTRGNPYVTIGHLLNQLLLADSSDLHGIVSWFKLDDTKLAADLTAWLDRLPRGALAIRDFAPEIEVTVRDAWMNASIVQGCFKIRSGHMILALKQEPELNQKLCEISTQFKKINADLLLDNFAAICADSAEATEVAVSAAAAAAVPGASGGAGSAGAAGGGGTGMGAANEARQALQLYTVDLTEKARNHQIDDIVGRDAEISKIIDVLLRRRQNNPIVTGEAGVGKTAVVEGFARRLADGQVPPALQGSRLLSLDLGLLQAGASVKGEFENRLRLVIDGVKNSDVPTILFIDEAHTLIGAGGTAGQNDAANLLKPALARGELRCIGATTYKEYVKYFEKDPALTRRFENIMIDEPDDDNAVKMLRHITGTLESHHQVQILDEALHAAVHLSRRYLPTRQLPDKAVSVLDTACARVALSQNSTPDEIIYLTQEISGYQSEQQRLLQEQSEGFDHQERLETIAQKLKECQEKLTSLQERYHKEQELFAVYHSARAALHQRTKDTNTVSTDPAQDGAADAATTPAQTTNPETTESQVKTEPAAQGAACGPEAQVVAARAALQEVQGSSPLILPEVDSQAVAAVIAEWTGIPVRRMVSDEVKGVLELKEQLCRNVIGQDHALSLLARRITTARAHLADPERPVAVLMFAGPSGVGKTETALTLSRMLYGSEQNLITINMSEFQESHTVSTLKGAPPGYVGYGEGGVLTEAVRRKPYSVVLLDEVEKAHKDVHELFFQVFDKGRMEDGSGRRIDFTNTVILLTTNAGDEVIMRQCIPALEAVAAAGDDPDALKAAHELFPEPTVLERAMRPELLKVFPAALLGRINIIPFYPLGADSLHTIIGLKLNKVVKRVAETWQAEVVIENSLYDEIISRCRNIASGARLIDAVINNDILPDISMIFLEAALEQRTVKQVTVSAVEGHFVVTAV